MLKLLYPKPKRLVVGSREQNRGLERQLTMRTILKAAIAVSIIGSSPLAIACDYPTAIEIPNGATATKDEMVAGVNAFKEWQQALADYRECIKTETNDAIAALADSGASAEEQEQSKLALEKQLTQKHDASVDEEMTRAEDMNAQIKLFKSK